MNPMQRFVPGLGQPLDFAAMAAGQGIGGGNPLADALAGSRQQNTLAAAPTLGNPQAQQAQQADLAAMMEAYKAAQGQQAFGESMMAPEYVQNSGALGALAMIAQAAAGHKLRKDATETASDYASRIFAEEQRMTQEQAAAQAKAEAERQAALWAREDKRDETKAQREERLAMLRIDAADRRTAQSAEARIRAAQIAASGQGGGATVLTPEEARAIGLAPGTVAQRDRNGKVSVLQGPSGPAAADPVAAREARAAAESAVEVLNRVGELEGLLNAGKNTGPLAQYIPGSDAQSFEAVSDALNVASLRSRFGGNPTEGEREANRRTLPNLARNEDVNRRLIESERAAALRRIEAYNAMPGVQPIPIPDNLRPAAPAGSGAAPGGIRIISVTPAGQ